MKKNSNPFLVVIFEIAGNILNKEFFEKKKFLFQENIEYTFLRAYIYVGSFYLGKRGFFFYCWFIIFNLPNWPIGWIFASLNHNKKNHSWKIQKKNIAHEGMKPFQFQKKSFYVDCTTTKQIRKKPLFNSNISVRFRNKLKCFKEVTLLAPHYCELRNYVTIFFD